jgi:hypothetical protein
LKFKNNFSFWTTFSLHAISESIQNHTLQHTISKSNSLTTIPSLHALDVEDIDDHGALGDLLHEREELRGDGHEAGGLHRQQGLNVCRAAARGRVKEIDKKIKLEISNI